MGREWVDTLLVFAALFGVPIAIVLFAEWLDDWVDRKRRR